MKGQLPRSTNPQDYPQWVRERVKALARKYANGHEDVVWQEFFNHILDYHAHPQSRRMVEIFAKIDKHANLLEYFLSAVEFTLTNRIPRSRNPDDYPAWVHQRVSEIAKRYLKGDGEAVWQKLYDEVESYRSRPNSRARRIVDVGARHFYGGNVLAFLLDCVEIELAEGSTRPISQRGPKRSARLHLGVIPKSSQNPSQNQGETGR